MTPTSVAALPPVPRDPPWPPDTTGCLRSRGLSQTTEEEEECPWEEKEMGWNELCHAENCRRGRRWIHTATPHRYAHTAGTKSDTHILTHRLKKRLCNQAEFSLSSSHSLPCVFSFSHTFFFPQPLPVSFSLTYTHSHTPHKHTIAATTKPPAGLASLCWQNTNYKSFSADSSLPTSECECVHLYVCVLVRQGNRKCMWKHACACAL